MRFGMLGPEVLQLQRCEPARGRWVGRLHVLEELNVEGRQATAAPSAGTEGSLRPSGAAAG
jgi:hypothetical protein